MLSICSNLFLRKATSQLTIVFLKRLWTAKWLFYVVEGNNIDLCNRHGPQGLCAANFEIDCSTLFERFCTWIERFCSRRKLTTRGLLDDVCCLPILRGFVGRLKSELRDSCCRFP